MIRTDRCMFGVYADTFSLVGRSEAGLVIRLHLSLEAAPPLAAGADKPDIYQYFVEFRLDAVALLQAADQWDLALASGRPGLPGHQDRVQDRLDLPLWPGAALSRAFRSGHRVVRQERAASPRGAPPGVGAVRPLPRLAA